MARQVFIELTASPNSGVAAIEGLAELFERQFSLIEARATAFATRLNETLSGIGAGVGRGTGGSGGGNSGAGTQQQTQREQELQATLQRGFALYEQQRQRVAQVAAGLRALGGDTQYTQAAIRNLEKVVDSANGRLLTIRERLAAGATATSAMSVSANIAVNRFNQLDQAIAQATERVRAQIAATGAGASGWERFQGSLTGVKDKLNDISNVLFGVGAALGAAGLAGIKAGESFLKSSGEVEAAKLALKSFGLSTEEVERQYKVLLELAKRPALDPQPLQQYSLQLQQLGTSFGDTTRVLAAFGNATARTGGGAEQFKGAIEQVLQSLRSGKVLSEDFKPLFRVLGDLSPALQNAFGTKDLDELRKKGLNSAQVITGIVEQFEKLPLVTGGTKNALENLGIAFDQFKAKIGDALAPVVVPILNKIADSLETIGTKIGALFSALPESLQTAIVLFTGLATAVGTALVGLAGVVKVGASISALFAEGGLLAGVGTFITGTLAPIAPLLLAIAAAAVALYAAFQTNFLGIRDYVLQAATAIQDTFGAAIEKVKADFGAVASDLSSAAQTIFGAVKSALAPLIAYWQTILDTLVSVVRVGFNLVKGQFEAIYEIIKGGITAIAKLINGDFAGAFKVAEEVQGRLVTIFQQTWTAISRIVEEAALRLLDKLLAVFGKVIEGARSFIDRIGVFFTVTLPAFLTRAAGSALDFVKSFISNLFTALSRVNEFINSLVARFAALGVRLFQAGIELGKSLWNGLIGFLQQVAEQGLTNVLLNAISRARQAIQNRLAGIASETATAASAGTAPAAPNAPLIDTSGKLNLPGANAAPKTKGGKSGKSSGLTDSQDQQINAIETQRTLAQELYERQLDDLSRSLKLKEITEREYSAKIADIYEARLKRLQQLSDREEAIIKSAKGLSLSDRNEKLDKIAEQRRKAIGDARKAELEANDKADEVDEKARIDHIKRLAKLQDDADKARITSIKDQADRLQITNEEAEQKIIAIETEKLKAQRRGVANERDNTPVADTSKRQQLEDDLNAINQEIDILRGQSENRLKDARKKDLDERRSYNEAVKKSNLDLLKSELDLAQATRDAGITDVGARRENARQIVELQKQIATENEKLAEEQIKIETEILVKRATLHGASQEEIERLQRESNQRIIAEQQRLQAEIQTIDQQSLAATAEGTFLGGLKSIADSLGQGGILDAAIANIQRLGTEAGKIKITFQGVKDVAAGTFGAISEKLGEVVGRFLLTGKTGANVFGQLINAGRQYLAQFIKQKAIEWGLLALENVAKGIAAATNPFTAYQAPGYFLAALKFGALAGVAGIAGSAIGGSGSAPAQQGTQAGSAAAADKRVDQQTEYLRIIAERQTKIEVALNIRTEEGILTDRAIRAYNQNGAFTNLLSNAGDPLGSYGATS